MRILGGLAVLAATVSLAACQTTPQQPPEEQQAIVSMSERVDATLRDAATSAEQRGDHQTALLHIAQSTLSHAIPHNTSWRYLGQPRKLLTNSYKISRRRHGRDTSTC